LNRRTLAGDNRVLGALLKPGQFVLDAGCGAGSITRGIAEAVGASGFVLCLDRDSQLLELARAANGDLPQLEFREADLNDFETAQKFDTVSAARVLQWIGQPERAIACMKRALRPGGCLVLLDYNHAANRWSPEPPQEFQRFYEAFLDWRTAHGWDNRMADRLPGLLKEAGFVGIEIHEQDEVARKDDPDFGARAALWAEVAESLGPKLVSESYLRDEELVAARSTYEEWRNGKLEVQVLSLKAIVAYVENSERLPQL
jgi:SAM-dependent methyltransferase